jgi:hypothetical protein
MDNHKLVLLAALSDSLDYLSESAQQYVLSWALYVIVHGHLLPTIADSLNNLQIWKTLQCIDKGFVLCCVSTAPRELELSLATCMCMQTLFIKIINSQDAGSLYQGLMHYGDSCHQWKWQAGVKQNVLGWILIWSEFGMGRLGQHKQVTPGSPMKRRVAKHRVHHHRRTSSALTAGLGLLAEKYSALSAECLRTLRVEMQFEAIYHLQVWFLPGHVVCHVRLC